MVLPSVAAAAGDQAAPARMPMAFDYPPEVRAPSQADATALQAGFEQVRLDAAARDLEALHRHAAEVLAVMDATFGPGHPARAVVAGQLATAMHLANDGAEAERLLDAAMASLSGWPTSQPQVRDLAIRFADVLLANDVPQAAWPDHPALRALQVQAHREPGAGDTLADAAWFDAAASIADADGAYEFAAGLRRRVLAIRERELPPDHVDVGSALNRLAATLSRLGRVGEADPLARRAMQVFDALPGAPVPARATVLGTLARLHALRGRPAEADALFREAVDVRRQLSGEDSACTLDAELDRASFLYAQGRLEEAAALYPRLLDRIMAKPRAGPRMLRALIGSANAISDPGECATAAEGFARLRGTYEAGPMASTALSMGLAEAHAGLLACAGRPREAAGLFETAFHRFLGLHEARNSAELAVASARYALVLSRYPESAEQAGWFASQAVWIAGSRRHQGTKDSDAPAFASAIERAVHTMGAGDPLSIAFDAQLAASWARLRPGDPFEATYRNQGFLAAQSLDVTGAAHAMAQTRARTAAGAGPLAAVVRRQQELGNRAVALDRDQFAALARGDQAGAGVVDAQMQAIERELASLGARLDAEFPDYARLLAPRAITVTELQQRLATDEALLLIVPSREDVHVFAISRTGAAWHRAQGAKASVASRVGRLRCEVDPATCGGPATGAVRAVSSIHGKGVAQGGRRFDRIAAYSLYRDLVEPVAATLEDASTVFVTASGALASLPLGVLVTEPPLAGEDDADPAVLARTRWFADRHALVTLPSVASLQPSRPPPTQADAGGAFLGLGAPRLGDDAAGARATGTLAALRGLASLPGTEVELRAMAGLFGGDARLLLGEEATESRVKRSKELGRARVVAFATHGLLPREAPGMDEPGLVLTPPPVATPEDDGLLTASEAAQLELAADWVILSACNTASADGSAGGESLSGLARAFLFAGAGSLLASHWRVADDATAALTTEALSQGPGGGVTRARSLQAAMRAVRTGDRADGSRLDQWKPGWAHPAMWAPFVLIANRDG